MILRWLGPPASPSWIGPPLMPGPIAVIIGPRGLQGNANKIEFDIGDGAATEFFLDHNFNDWGVGVWVYRNAAPGFNVLPDIGRVSADQIHLVFNTAPTFEQFHVIIMTTGLPAI